MLSDKLGDKSRKCKRATTWGNWLEIRKRVKGLGWRREKGSPGTRPIPSAPGSPAQRVFPESHLLQRAVVLLSLKIFPNFFDVPFISCVEIK